MSLIQIIEAILYVKFYFRTFVSVVCTYHRSLYFNIKAINASTTTAIKIMTYNHSRTQQNLIWIFTSTYVQNSTTNRKTMACTHTHTHKHTHTVPQNYISLIPNYFTLLSLTIHVIPILSKSSSLITNYSAFNI